MVSYFKNRFNPLWVGLLRESVRSADGAQERFNPL